MSDRRLALTITLGDVGSGTVVRNMPPEALIEPGPTGIVSPSPATGTENIRLFEKLASRRPGYDTLATISGEQINSAGTAIFDPASHFLVVGTNSATAPGGAVRFWNAITSTFDLVTPTATEGRGLFKQPWSFAMVPNPTLIPPNVLIMGNPASSMYTWPGGATSAVEITDVLAPTGPFSLISFLSRAYAFNVTSVDGDKIPSRLAWSVVGDSRNWSSLGSGSLDLDQDPHPGVAMLVIGGRLVLFKGGKDGGAIYVGTPTGVSTAPLRIDAINPNTNIGPVIPRSVVSLTSTTAFFLGHDAAYLYDGVRALQPFAETIARNITSRLTAGAESAGFSYYDRQTRVVRLFVAVDDSLVPNEAWEFDIRTRRAYGPLMYTAPFTSAQSWIPVTQLSWDTWGQASGRTWDTLTDIDGDQYFQWDNVIGDPSVERTVYVSSDGGVYTSTEDTLDDASTPIACTWTGPAITPKGWVVPTSNPQVPRRLRDYDQLTLRSVVLRHRSSTPWIPVVEISTDGENWTKISDDTTASAAGTRLRTKTYTVNDQPPASWYQPRVRNTNGDEFTLRDITLEFTYAGSARHTGGE